MKAYRFSAIFFATILVAFGAIFAYAEAAPIKILSNSTHAAGSISGTITQLLGRAFTSDEFVIHLTSTDSTYAGNSVSVAVNASATRYNLSNVVVPNQAPYHLFTSSFTGYPGDTVTEYNYSATYDIANNYAFSNSPATPWTAVPPAFFIAPGITSYPSSYGVEWRLDETIFCASSLSCLTAANAGMISVLRWLHSTSTPAWNWFDAKAALRQTGTNWATGYDRTTYGFGQVNYTTANALTSGQILLQPPAANVATSTSRISFTVYPFKQTRRVKEVLFQFPSAPAFQANELTLSAIEALGGTKITEYTGTTATTSTPIFATTTSAYFVWLTADNATDASASFSRIDTYSILGPVSQGQIEFNSSFNIVTPTTNAISATQSPTFTWTEVSSYFGVSKYQLFVDGVLDKDNISGTSATPTSNLSVGTHTWYIKAINGNSAATTTTSTPTINIVPGYTAGYTFYVDNVLGNDNNPGTQALPWATFTKAGITAQAGDTVIIIKNTGMPYREILTISNDGTSGSPITFRGVDLNSKPEIWGSADISSGWSVYGGGNPDTYQYATTTSVKVLAAGPSVNSLTKKTKGTATATLNPGEWFWVSNVLYYRLAAGEVMGSLHIEASMRSYGIQNAGLDYILYKDIITRYANANGVYITGTGVTAQGIEAYESQAGFLFGGPNETVSYSIAARNAASGITLSYPNNIRVYNLLTYGNGTSGLTFNAYSGLTFTVKNILSAGNTTYPFTQGNIINPPTLFTASNNLWDTAVSSLWTSTYKGTNNQVLVDPLLVATSTSNFALTPLSPAIDTGVAISGLTTDILGNPIYGTPDIGPYEYQPPYTIGTHDIDITGGVRLYKNGKYRYTNATTTGTTASMNITPVGGFPTGDYSEFLNLSITTWNTSGDYSKTWTETSTTATSTLHTIGNLRANTYYNILVDSTQYASMLTDGSGQGTFIYTGGYSTHTFNVTEDTGTLVAATPVTAPAVSSSSQAFTWVAASDPAGIAKYQLYTDGALKADDITGTSASATGFSCGTHTWYVRAIDNAGNATDSGTQSFDVTCGGGIFTGPSSALPGYVAPRMQTIADGKVTYLDAPLAPTPTSAPTPSGTHQTPTSTAPSFVKAIKRGSKGSDVSALQVFLKKDPMLYPEGIVNGNFGPATERALKRFQKKYNIASPGVAGYGLVGPKTRAKLNTLVGQ